ncbi:hypothetical protein F4801DRAFT_570860 [Xylaria longipes]|nr:hypothetical protein F4801DRAFT_570860 [Xylaria longipes]
MFEGAPMFPSHINDMGAFIDSVLGGSVDPCAEVSTNTKNSRCPFAEAERRLPTLYHSFDLLHDPNLRCRQFSDSYMGEDQHDHYHFIR